MRQQLASLPSVRLNLIFLVSAQSSPYFLYFLYLYCKYKKNTYTQNTHTRNNKTRHYEVYKLEHERAPNISTPSCTGNNRKAQLLLIVFVIIWQTTAVIRVFKQLGACCSTSLFIDLLTCCVLRSPGNMLITNKCWSRLRRNRLSSNGVMFLSHLWPL